MPTYDYKCSKCGHAWEQFQSIKAEPSKKCPSCGKKSAQRLIGTGAGLIFKGSGFYITDYRSDSYKEGAKSESGAKPETAAKSETGAKSESGTKTETKSAGSDAKPAADARPAAASADSKPAAKSDAAKSPPPAPTKARSDSKKR